MLGSPGAGRVLSGLISGAFGSMGSSGSGRSGSGVSLPGFGILWVALVWVVASRPTGSLVLIILRLAPFILLCEAFHFSHTAMFAYSHSAFGVSRFCHFCF